MWSQVNDKFNFSHQCSEWFIIQGVTVCLQQSFQNSWRSHTPLIWEVSDGLWVFVGCGLFLVRSSWSYCISSLWILAVIHFVYWTNHTPAKLSFKCIGCTISTLEDFNWFQCIVCRGVKILHFKDDLLILGTPPPPCPISGNSRTPFPHFRDQIFKWPKILQLRLT